MREILSAVEVTAPPAASNVRQVPLDVLMQKAIRANSRVVAAVCAVDKAERALEQARTELTTAEAQRLEAQYELLHRQIQSGAFEGVKNFQKLAEAGKREDPGDA
jgi:hypothetical protein